jgi:multidrug efflux pump subunit AcrA (membrane-fusion protein)
MKFKLLCLPVILSLALVACSGVGSGSTAIPTIVLGNPASTPALNSTGSASGGVTASGIVVASQVANMAFGVPGNLTQVQVAVGDQVKAGQVLLQLDDSAQQLQLQQAGLALQEFVSPEAIANAKLAVTKAELDVTNAQSVVNNQQYWQNEALVQNYYASFVIAKDNLDKAQSNYDNAHVGQYINNADEAALYQALYVAKQAYDNAKYYYSLYSQKPTQRQLDDAQANLELANASLKNAQAYLTLLTGGSLPEGASGAALQAYQQAKLAVQSAQNNLNVTRLVAPFAGEIASITVSSGDYVLPGQVALVLSDVSHMHVETTDLSERDVPQVKLGQTVTVSVKALNQSVAGKVNAISPLADSLGGDVVYKTTIQLDALPAGIRAGMSVEVQFNISQ